MDGSMSWYFLTRDNMSLNYGSAMKSQWQPLLRGRWTLWRLVNMTFRGLTERQEQSRNAAHTSAITHKVDTNGWNQLHHSRGCIAAGDRSRSERDCGRRWMTRDGTSPDVDRGRIWIAAGYGCMTGGGWQEVDDRSWISGDGSRETDDNQSPFLYEAMKLQSSADMQTYDFLAAWLYRLNATVPMPNTILNQSRVTKVQWRYRTSRTRLIFGGVMIFKEKDDSAWFAMTLNTKNYRTGSAWTKHWNAFPDWVGKQRQVHMEKKQQLYSENSEKCTQGSDGKPTYRWIKKPYAPVTNPNEILTQSWRSWLSLGDPDSVSTIPRYTAATGNQLQNQA